MARQGSARCYGGARQREGSRQNSIGVLGPPGRCSGCWPHDGEVAGGAVADLGLLISGAALTLFLHHAREGADGQAVVCPLLRGSSPTRGVAPKQHLGLRRAFSPAFRAGSLYPLAGGCRRIWRGEGWLRRARCCSTGSGRLGGAAAAGRTMESFGLLICEG